MRTVEVLRLWAKATPVPLGKSPTVMVPLETHDVGDGEVIEVHKDDSGTYRAILIRKKGQAEEVRALS
jgi:hypothetical protein